MRSIPRGGLHPRRPAVYLDQWVWVHLASAALGKPRNPGDVEALDAIRGACAKGVAFPLSATHYIETTAVKDPRQRRDLAAVMAPISFCQSLRATPDLVRHQMLTAMHERIGRPTFRPSPLKVLGIGADWALTGKQGRLRLLGPDGEIEPEISGVLTSQELRQANQWAEVKLLTGPDDDEVDGLRGVGYQPEKAADSAASRLAWEELYVGMLRDAPISRSELRVRVMTREVVHEHHALLVDLLGEHRVSLTRLAGGEPMTARSRAGMIDFADRMPSVRIAVDMKTELFRNTQRTWSGNHLHDIDALSVAVPYCRVVVTDKDAAASLTRTKADERNGTVVLSRLADVTDMLGTLETEAASAGGDVTGWDCVRPGSGFDPTGPEALRRTA
jgi:hypothetical protein